jgi:prepilin-type N-terminal cleavage/methylation domain-containing protein
MRVGGSASKRSLDRPVKDLLIDNHWFDDHLEEANGFTLVEVIVAILVLSLALLGIFELFRAGLTYRANGEALARNLESAQLVKKTLDASLGDIQNDLLEVTSETVRFNGQLLVKLAPMSPDTSNPNATIKLERYVLNGRRSRLAQSVTLRGANLRLVPRFSNTGRLTHIVVGATINQKNNQPAFTPMALSALYVTGRRPCAFDTLTGACLDIEP